MTTQSSASSLEKEQGFMEETGTEIIFTQAELSMTFALSINMKMATI